MNIVACMTVFNEEEQFSEAIRSIKSYVDRFVIVDVVFDTNPVDATHSTDGTRAAAEKLCKPVPLTYIESDRKLPENTARNLYLNALEPGDWALVIDGDEVLYGGHSQIVALVDGIRAGQFSPPERRPGLHEHAIGIPVYTQMIQTAGTADRVSRKTYDLAPIICSVGIMARFFEVGDPRYPNGRIRYPDGPSNQGLSRYGKWVGQPAAVVSDVLMVNHRVRQSHAGYLNDHKWLSKVRS